MNLELELKKSPHALRVYSSRVNLKKIAGEYTGICPFHSETTPSFKLFEQDGVLLFKCFGCDASGNIFQFVQKADNCGFSEAVEKVKFISEWRDGQQKVDQTFKNVIAGEKEYLTFPIEKLLEAEKALAANQKAADFLSGRGISLQTAQRFHLGYVQSARAVTPTHPWLADGWILFPTIEKGVVTCLKYRSIRGKKTETGEPGFLRKSGMRTGLFNSDAIEPFDDVFVTEGEIDTLTLAQAGFIAVSLPSAGFSPTPEMRDRIVQANTIYLAGDMDAPGRACMTKLWSELRDRTYLIEWPEGCKDANDALQKACGGRTEDFRVLVEDLKQKARSKPIPHFYDLKETVRKSDTTNPMDDPRRLHFPWKPVDEMAVCRPGSVVSSYATYTGSGKTTWWLAVQLFEAIQHGSVVINYSAELSPDEISDLVIAIIAKKHRLELTPEDRDAASELLRDARFYIGYNPDASNIKQVLGDGTDKFPGLLEWAIRRLGANIVVLDHLHFFTSGDRDATTAEAAAMTRIKNLAVKYNLIFIVIGQSRKAQPSQKYKVSEGSDAKGSEALAVGTGVMTPTGFRRIENLSVGDEIIGSDGKSTKITDVIPQGEKQAYKIDFSDGVSIECDAGHLWAVRSPNRKLRGHDWEIKRTEELFAGNLSWKKYNGYDRWRWHVPNVKPVEFLSVPLPLHPYLLGSLLGDGGFTGPTPVFTTGDAESLDLLRAVLPLGHKFTSTKKGQSWRVVANEIGSKKNKNVVREELGHLGLWGLKSEKKFIPHIYRITKAENRLEMLRGLLDTDGWVVKGKVRYCTTSPYLAEQVVWLVRSLGGIVTTNQYPAPDHGNFPTNILKIWLPDVNPFKLKRKADAYRRLKTRNRSIVAIAPTTEKDMICLKVDAPDGLFVTENFIVTHNSFVSTANTTYHIHRDIRRDINFDDPASWPSDILDQKTDIRLYKCRTKGPGKAVARLWFEGANGRFREMLPELGLNV